MNFKPEGTVGVKPMEYQETTEDEFESFSYIISHDLKSPLRAIQILTDWIVRENADRLTESGKEHLVLLQDRVKRMDHIIDAVSRYSRIGRVKIEPESVDLNQMIDYHILVTPVPDHIQCIKKKPLPVVRCKRALVTEVFQHLIDNAIRYMDKPEGRVEIDFSEEKDFWRFSVSDNGPGIDEKYHRQIFKIFASLHGRDDGQSRGVGLTLSKRIAELSGGRIWLESRKGEGCTFFFTLPKDENRN
ncbi:MAG TPA: hypothetical protein ENN03_05905 [bacterium]|nr:hypothetical protein [bacterium]